METPAVLASFNGVTQPLASVRVSPLDRAYLFGDAVYEVIRVYAGRPFRLERHLDRLRASLAALAIPHDIAVTRERLAALLAVSAVREGSVYLQISRGEAKRTHVPAPGMQPNELMWLEPLPVDFGAAKRAAGVTVALCPDLRWGLCRAKTTNLLGNVVAGLAAQDQGATEALLYDESGRVTEGMHSTFFAVDAGRLVTTPLGANVLPGITREVVLEIARALGIETVERSVARGELPAMQELFFTGTLSEIQPIVAVDGTAVGDGRPGPLARRLQERFVLRVSAECAS